MRLRRKILRTEPRGHHTSSGLRTVPAAHVLASCLALIPDVSFYNHLHHHHHHQQLHEELAGMLSVQSALPHTPSSHLCNCPQKADPANRRKNSYVMHLYLFHCIYKRKSMYSFTLQENFDLPCSQHLGIFPGSDKKSIKDKYFEGKCFYFTNTVSNWSTS